MGATDQPKTQGSMIQACQELTRHNVPYPKGITTVMQWGRTVITMKKYSHMNISYAEIAEMAEKDERSYEVLLVDSGDLHAHAGRSYQGWEVHPSTRPCLVPQEDWMDEV